MVSNLQIFHARDVNNSIRIYFPVFQALPISAEEGAAIARCFKMKDFSPFMQTGVRVNNVKYNFLRSEDDKVVICKKKDFGALTLQASKTGKNVTFC